jgi:DNA-binding transcriptional ArsR family regulator
MNRIENPDVLLLQAAADPARLGILRQLSEDGPTCACDFVDCCRDLSQSTVSHHLKVLRESGWIVGERRGTWIWYSIRPEAAARFTEIAQGIRPGARRTVTSLAAADEPRALQVVRPSWRAW